MTCKEPIKETKAPIKVKIECIINGPNEVLKDILLNPFKNEENLIIETNSLAMKY